MQKLLRRAFGIYSGEGKNTLRFVRFSVLWAFSSTSLDTLSDGLFLEHVGAHNLPMVYLISSSVLMLLSSLIVYSLKIVSPYRILLTVMYLGLLFTGLAVGAFYTGATPIWFWYGLKTYTLLFYAIFLACGWTFIDQYHDLQDAKRIYSLYSAAYFLGIVISGVFINFFLTEIGRIPFYCILIATIVFAIFEVKRIAKVIPALHDDTIEGVFSGDRHGFTSMCKLILKSPYTMALLAFSLFHMCLIYITEFNFMQGFEEAFQNQEIKEKFTADSVSEFLGKCRAFISLSNIIIGAFCYRSIIRRMRLHNAIVVIPVLFLVMYSGWLVHSGFWISLIGLIIVDGLSFTLEDNSYNLLTKAVHPKLKSKVRIINDSFFEPFGMLVCSLSLFLWEKHHLLLGLIFSIITLGLIFIVRGYYPKAVYTSLKEQTIHFERKIRTWLKGLGKREKKEAFKELNRMLHHTNSSLKLSGMKALLELGKISMLPKILSSSANLQSDDQIKLISMLEKSTFSEDPSVTEHINRWFETSEDLLLKKRAHFYLAKRGLLHPDKVIDDLDSDDLILRGAAIITLNKSTELQDLETISLHRTIALKETDLMLKSNDPDEICMGLEILREAMGRESAEKALIFLHHDDKAVRQAAAHTLSVLASKKLSRHAHKMIEVCKKTSEQAVRQGCLLALGKIANSTTVKEIILSTVHFRPQERRLTEEIITKMGLKTVPSLLSIVKNNIYHDRCRILAGKILATLALPQLQANLYDILEKEISRAYFYFYFSRTIQKKYPLYDLMLLEEALQNSFHSKIDFIIHLLGAAGSIEDSELLVRSMRSQNQKTQGNAIETLERTCESRIFTTLLPLIDDIPFSEKLEAASSMVPNTELSLSELLDTLSQSSSLSDKVVAAKLKVSLEMPDWRKFIKKQITECDETFHHFAHELLKL
jgi:hypothetical protein